MGVGSQLRNAQISGHGHSAAAVLGEFGGGPHGRVTTGQGAKWGVPAGVLGISGGWRRAMALQLLLVLWTEAAGGMPSAGGFGLLGHQEIYYRRACAACWPVS